tara:strand:+ start:439 stop:816 length:378 start_codon:yes stop_codon:yes gene_type:complete
MSNLKLCQGTKCHTYFTQDRIKGQKGHKTNQTRRRSTMYYGNNNFCDQRCMNDWINEYIDQALDHFGRTTEIKHLTEDNAWVKNYDYRGYKNLPDEHYCLNTLTRERRTITEQQYNDNNYNLNER